MTEALYRKWRPKLWDEVISQEHIVRTLKNAVMSDHLAHAYLFSGPRGTGKTTAARLLAKAVNCLNPDTSNRPCNECGYCLAVNENRFMDLIEIDAASNNGVDDIRQLRENINFSPSQGKYRVYIIDEVHMLSTSAFNAILKTLEEPPAHAIFILATTEIHKIPATVISRCQRHEFRRVPQSEIVRHLKDICESEGIQADPEAISTIARQASGGMRDAISLLDQLSSTGNRITIDLAQDVLGTATNQSVLDLVQTLVEKNPGAGLDAIHRTLDSGADVRSFARQIVDYFRGLMLIQLNNADQVEVSGEVKKQMVEHAGAFSTQEVLRMMRLFNATATDSRSGWTPSLGLELAFAESLEKPAAVELQAAPRAAASTSSGNTHPEANRQQPAQRQNPFQAKPAENQAAAPVSSQQTSRPAETPAAAQSKPVQKETVNAQPQTQVTSSLGSAAVQKNGLSVSLEQIRSVWKQLGTLIKEQDPNLSALINSGKPSEILNGKLIISFQSDILVEKFQKPEYIELTNNTLKKLLKIDISVQGSYTSAKKSLPAHIDPDGMLAAASSLGGEIIDSQKLS